MIWNIWGGPTTSFNISRQNLAMASGTSRQLTCVRSASMMRDEVKDFIADTQMESTDLRAEMMATSIWVLEVP